MPGDGDDVETGGGENGHPGVLGGVGELVEDLLHEQLLGGRVEIVRARLDRGPDHRFTHQRERARHVDDGLAAAERVRQGRRVVDTDLTYPYLDLPAVDGITGLPITQLRRQRPQPFTVAAGQHDGKSPAPKLGGHQSSGEPFPS
ncbi:hypothetical protein MXD63_26840 [Frankia sp. Cpl3]|nr:hypothetical protein [Frankia sp. Cpl3]